jgi:hypothetical protein
MNSDLGLRICGSRLGGFVDGREDRGQFGGFLFQRGDLGSGQQFSFLDQFEPQERFVCFFQCAANLVHPIGIAASATGSAIARGNRGGRPKNLIRNNFPFLSARQRVRNRHHSKSKLLSSSLQFFPVHSDNLAAPILFRNHKS